MKKLFFHIFLLFTLFSPLYVFSAINIKKYSQELENSYKKEIQHQINLFYFDSLILEVNSKTNMMILKGYQKNILKKIKSYKVSTAKKSIQKPLGLGKITNISLKPKWFPTQATIKRFAKRNIKLPREVPYKHKYNYMGSAKISLNHKVRGKQVYRIHGTLNESTIGTNESSGCIRMKNQEVYHLASVLKKFIEDKGLSKIKVLLK